MRRKQVIWIALGVFAIVAGMFFHSFPYITESLYGRGIFPVLRWTIARSVALLPIPGITLVFLCCLPLLWVTAIRPLIRRQWSFRSFLVGFLSTIAGAVFLFQFLWGFNYARPTWDERLDLHVNGMTAQQLADEYARATEELCKAVDTIGDVEVLSHRNNRAHEASVASELRHVLEVWNYPVSATPRVRIVRPKGILLRWSTAGIYVPYSGEGHVDAGMLPVQIPFTLAHEMAHGFGVADEADCNFLAYLACRSSDDPYVRLAGILSYWRYVASEYRFTFPDIYNKDFDKLPDLVKRLLAEIRANDAKYPDLFPKLRNTVYDTYLKSQGVPDGLHSYNRVVQMVWAYEQRELKKTIKSQELPD